MPWSEAQVKAIETKNKNLLVAAAAGSGKTAVLVERIIRRLLRGECDVDKLLVVTFTNAAAAEMRARIEAALHEKIEQDPQALGLERQLILLSNASISTMHSFCQSVIRHNFQDIDLDPKFRLAGEQELQLIRQEVMEDLFEQKYAAGDEAFLRFADEYGNEHGDEALYHIVLHLYQYAQSQPFPWLWLDSLARPFQLAADAALADTVWMKIVRQDIRRVLDDVQARIGETLELAGRLGAEFYEPVLVQDRDIVDRLQAVFDTGSWDELQQAFLAVKFAVLRTPKGTDEAVREAVKKPREAVKSSIKSLAEKYFQENEQELIEDMRAVAPVLATICNLTREFADAFAAEKKERVLADFNDLEHFALQILCLPGEHPGELLPSPAAVGLQQRFTEVMVDEYQDTNGVQEAILSLVRRQDRPNLFTVGDVKQSIYRFRLADPSLFLEKYRSYPQMGQDCERIDLSQNFRSRPEILSAINFIFSQVMVPGSMELDYDDAAALHAGPDYPVLSAGRTLAGPVEFDILDCDASSQSGEDAATQEGILSQDAEDEELRGFSLEAQHIANRLKALMAGNLQVFDKTLQAYRSLQWRDVVVLLRSVKGKANILLETLRTNDIPAYASVDAGYFEETEVRVMLALLTVIDNARQDIPLAAVLYSPIGGMGTAELAALRLTAPDEDLFTALLRANEPDSSLTPELRERVAVFLQQLEDWRRLARRVSVPALIWQLYRDTGYYEYVGGMPGGLLRQANLRMLCDRAEAYEQTDFRGLFRFLRFIGRMQEMDTDLAVARTLGESENVVRIMSVHKSKGLEFPVVVLADIGKSFNLMDAKDALLMHRTLGLGPYRVELDKSLRYPTFARQAVSAQIVQEDKAEELRVLYVALTRAREKLILVGSAHHLTAKAAAWCRYIHRTDVQLPDYAAIGAGSYLDWLGMAVCRHDDGAVLRDLADIGEDWVRPNYADSSRWQVNVIPAADIRADFAEHIASDAWLDRIQQHEPLPSTQYQSAVTQILDWKYNMRGLEEVPAKLSVTEIKRRFALEDMTDAQPLIPRQFAFKRPGFIQQTRHLTGTEYGTIMHSALQHIDLSGDLSLRGIREQLRSLVQRELLLPAQYEAVSPEVLQAFFASPLGMRMRAARRLWRELPFSRMLPAARFYPEVTDETAQIFSQGIIDVLFEEADGLVLLDYKTDRDTTAVRARQRYDIQIRLYREAVEGILHQKIKDSFLYMLHDGTTICM